MGVPGKLIRMSRIAPVFILILMTTFGDGLNFIASEVQEEDSREVYPEKECTLNRDNTINARAIILWQRNLKLALKTDNVFVVKFRKKNTTEEFQCICPNKPGTNVGIQFKDGTYGNCSFARQKTEGEAVTFCLQAYERVPASGSVVDILLPVLAAEVFTIIVFLGVWRLSIKYHCFDRKNELNFFDVELNRNISDVSEGLFPSSPISIISSERSSKLSEHQSHSSEENKEITPKQLAPEIPLTIEIPEIKPKESIPVDKGNVTKPQPPLTLPKPKQSFTAKLSETLSHQTRFFQPALPPAELPKREMDRKPQNQQITKPQDKRIIPGFLTELEQKQKYILRTKVKNNIERDSRIVSTEIEHVEILNKKCNRGTYIDMSGLHKLKRNPEKEGIYENMTALRRMGQMIGRTETKNEHMCSRIIGKEEAHYYEIGSSECDSIFGNLKDRNPDRPVIWNMKTREKEFTYITKIETKEEVNRRKKLNRFRISKQTTSFEPQYISVFFDDRSNTDSIGTGSDFDRLSYISALDGVYRSSASASIHNGHFAYVFDGMKESKLPGTDSPEFINKAFEDSTEKDESLTQRLSIASSDSGLSDDESKENGCLVCCYHENVVYVNISEVQKPPIPPKKGGFRRKGSVKSTIEKKEEIRVRIVNNENEQRKSTIHIE
ncbi:uncharacterized protein LOC125675029 isoform X2 [Ostrea edulis]|uniref:uncharacterized protein LOC125675029 isoform X2 n=1 Tax=Ostrea edulis TaxID=37623 RepID=UPI0024AF6C08|nr:uncharacterized protein LOC125675029 isoform X2 [Ostrea edulis]